MAVPETDGPGPYKGHSGPVITGCWQLSAGHHGQLDNDETFAGLQRRITLGMSTLDCGDIYTGVETLIGKFRTSAQHCTPEMRSKIRVHTKLVADFDTLNSVDAQYVEATLRRSIRRLRQEGPLDLVQFSWWDYKQGDLMGAFEAVAALASGSDEREQLVRHVGLTNFDTATTRRILDTGAPVLSTQVQLSLLDRRVISSGLTALCADRQVAVFCYGSLAGGLLSDRWLGKPEPAEWSAPMDAETRSLTKYLLVAREFGTWQLVQSLLAVLRSIADRCVAWADDGSSSSASIAQVAVAWVLQQPGVTSCVIGLPRGAGIPGSQGAHRSEEVLASARIKLGAADLEAINEVLSQSSGPSGEFYAMERERDGRHGKIMRYNLSRIGCVEHAGELVEEWQALSKALQDSKGETAAVENPSKLCRQLRWEACYCLKALSEPHAQVAPDNVASLKKQTAVRNLQELLKWVETADVDKQSGDF